MTSEVRRNGPALHSVDGRFGLPRGRILRRSSRHSSTLSYFLYLPRTLRSDRLLVCVHGISRSAKDQVLSFAAQADRFGVGLVAPLFPKTYFSDYQRLGRRGLRSDIALDRMVVEVASLCGASSERIWLFGYSGGGQFAHRYAMAHPERVAAVVVAAAGWYTFPDAGTRYPRGTAASGRYPELDFAPGDFLRVPALVLVGSRDLDRDGDLRSSVRLDRQQGADRIDRGRRWIEAMTAAAREHGLETRYEFDLLEDCGHSFRQCATQGGLASQALEFFSETAAQAVESAGLDDPLREMERTAVGVALEP